MGKLNEALQKSEEPERKQQAASWKVFKSPEPGPNGNVLYIFVIDPAVKGADYTVSKILAEAFPTEVQDLYKKFSDAYAGGPEHRQSAARLPNSAQARVQTCRPALPTDTTGSQVAQAFISCRPPVLRPQNVRFTPA